jgi:hypothetical protein
VTEQIPPWYPLIGRAVTSLALVLGWVLALLMDNRFPDLIVAFTVGWVVLLGCSAVWYVWRALRCMGS